MVRMAVMGDTESIKGFAAVGLDIYPCDDPQEAVRRFRSLTGGEYGVIYITEAIFFPAGQGDQEAGRTASCLPSSPSRG